MKEDREVGCKDPQHAVIEMDAFHKQMIRWSGEKNTWQVYAANERQVW